ncbi:AAA family ATPase [Streptomyces sp. NPDC093060]|uniref:AAA family ATPase n=1 Tax=Streptomyces sp. NPDC093060 TaxID=3366019 RepID=UPI00382CC07C
MAQGSLSDRLMAERLRYFVGRDHELRVFESALTRYGSSRKSIFGVHGPGGIGKSTLLQRIGRTAVREGRVVLEAEANSASAFVDILDQWADRLNPSTMRHFRRARRKYLKLEQSVQGIRDAVVGGTAKSLESFGPIGGFVTGALGEERVRTALTSILSPAEADSVLGAIKWVTDSFLEDLTDSRAAADGCVLMIDRYEAAPPSLDEWVRESVLRSANLRADTLLVVAGRRPLERMNSRWTEWSPLSVSLEIKPFSLGELQAYFAAKRVSVTRRSAEKIYHWTKGIPWAVALVSDQIDLVSGSEPMAESVQVTLQEQLILRFMSHLQDQLPDVRETLEAACVAQNFTSDLLEHVLQRSISDDLTTLAEYSFVRRTADGYAVDEPVAEFVTDDLRGRSPERFRQHCLEAAGFYRGAAARQTASPTSWRRSFSLLLYFLARVDVDSALDELRGGSATPTGISLTNESEFINTIRRASEHASESPELRCLTGLSHLASGRLDEGYAELDRLLRSVEPELSASSRLLALTGIVDACHRRGNIDDALSWCAEGLELARLVNDDSAEAIFLARYAETYGVLGRLAASVQFTVLCESVLAQVTDTRVAAEIGIMLGYVYAFRADCAAARRHAVRAAGIAPERGRPTISALADSIAAWTHGFDGLVEDGWRSGSRAYRFFREQGDIYHASVAALNIAEVLRKAARRRSAIRWNMQAMKGFSQINGGAYHLAASAQLSSALLGEGRVADTIRELAFLSDENQTFQPHDRFDHGVCRVNLGQALGAETTTEGRAALEFGVDLLLGSQNGYGAILARHWQARLDGDLEVQAHVATLAADEGWWDLSAMSRLRVFEEALRADPTAVAAPASDVVVAATASNIYLGADYARIVRDALMSAAGVAAAHVLEDTVDLCSTAMVRGVPWPAAVDAGLGLARPERWQARNPLEILHPGGP